MYDDLIIDFGEYENEIKIEVTRYRVVDIPSELYDGCPDIRKTSIPNYKELTDDQVAKFVVNLYKNNIKCRQTIQAIHNYLNDAHKTIDNKPVNLH
jgi:hypothetical protein